MKNISLFENLNESLIKKVSQLFHKVDLEKNTRIYTQGNAHKSLYLLSKGQLGIYHKDTKTDQIIGVAALGFTSLFIKDAIATCNIVCETPCEAFQADRLEFEDLSRNSPELSLNLMTYMAQEIRYWRDHQVDVLLENRNDKYKKMVVFDSKSYDKKYFGDLIDQFLEIGVQITFIDARLGPDTVSLAAGATIVCVFVNDDVNTSVVEKLKAFGVEMIALRCAGMNFD